VAVMSKDERGRVEQLVMRLRQYNDWRRGADCDQPLPIPVGKDIDDAIATIEKYIKLLDKCNEKKTTEHAE